MTAAASDLRDQLRPPSAKVAAETARRNSDAALAERMRDNAHGVLPAPTLGQTLTLDVDQWQEAVTFSARRGHLDRLADTDDLDAHQRIKDALIALGAPIEIRVLAWPQMTGRYPDGNKPVMGQRGDIRFAVEFRGEQIEMVARTRQLGLPVLPCPEHLTPVYRQPRKPTWAPR